jgi:hypothetical protein
MLGTAEATYPGYGSVQEVNSQRLRDQFRNSGDTSSTPNSPGPNTLLYP